MPVKHKPTRTKKVAKTVNTKSAERAPKDRTLDDMQRFYSSLDLATLWNDFYVSIDAGGRPKWKSSRQFAKSVAQNGKQLEFLVWLLGSKVDDPRMKILYPFASPLDFDGKRDSGGWFTAQNLREHSKAIRQEINALEALRNAGNGITINSLSRMEHLAQKLDEDFQGRFFVDGLTFKENTERAKVYLALHGQLLQLIGLAQDLYAKSHGINFQDMSGFERLLTAQALMMQASGQATKSKAEDLFQKLAVMALEKHTKHNTPIPAEVEHVIVLDAKKKNLM